MSEEPIIRSFFDEATNTVSHLVADPHTGAAAVIDPVLDFDPASGKVGTTSAEKLLAEVEKEGWFICWVLETHAHADHLSAAQFIKDTTGATIAIGEGILDVQKAFGPMLGAYDVEDDGGEAAGQGGGLGHSITPARQRFRSWSSVKANLDAPRRRR